VLVVASYDRAALPSKVLWHTELATEPQLRVVTEPEVVS